MRHSFLSREKLALLAAFFAVLHGLSLFAAKTFPFKVSMLAVLPPALATVACLWRAMNSPKRPRLLWGLASTGLAIWTFAAAMAVREVFVLNAPENLGSGSQIVYFMYGIPLLLAIAVQTEASVSSPLFWLDGLQVAITGFLIYLEVFNVAPFLSQPVQPVSIGVVVLTFNVENLCLAVAATLRYLSAPPREDLRWFYRSLMAFLWTYAIAAGIYNSLDMQNGGATGWQEVLTDLPFLGLCVFALCPVRATGKLIRSARATSFALVLDHGASAIFPAAVLALGIAIARKHFVSGMASVAASLVVYGIRSTLLQVRYQRAQAEMRAARDQMEILSLTDPLTGISNRRHFDTKITNEWKRLSRQPGPLSLLLIDIDHFKYLNDAFGHSEGDICLRQVAHALQASLRRESDSMARYGGEEFAAILPNTDAEGAEAVALRMSATLRSMRLRSRTPLGDIVTVSIGRATCELPCNEPIEMLFDAADRALYRAKQNGRDCTAVEPLTAKAPVASVSSAYSEPTVLPAKAS